MPIEIPGLKEYGSVRDAYDRLNEILEEAEKLRTYIASHKEGAAFVKAEEGKKFDSRMKEADKALACYAPGALEKIVAGPEAIAAYERLASNPLLYDASCKQWNWYMTEGGELKDDSTLRKSIVQLLGVTALALIGRKQEAEKVYDLLIETPLWDSQRKQWNSAMDAAQQLKDTTRFSDAQLSGIATLAALGRMRDANENYDSLLKTPLWDRQRKQWNNIMNAAQQVESTTRPAGNLLMGIITLAALGRMDEANEMYDALLKTPLYDAQKKQWNSAMDAAQQLKDTSRDSSVQLLGISLLAMQGGAREANEAYERLLETGLRDKKNERWYTTIDEKGKIKNNLIGVFNNLIGVIALAALGR